MKTTRLFKAIIILFILSVNVTMKIHSATGSMKVLTHIPRHEKSPQN